MRGEGRPEESADQGGEDVGTDFGTQQSCLVTACLFLPCFQKGIECVLGLAPVCAYYQAEESTAVYQQKECWLWNGTNLESGLVPIR